MPPLSFEEAAAFSAAFLEDLAGNLGSLPAALRIAVPPGAEISEFPGAITDTGFETQGEGDLGHRLASVTERALGLGSPAVCVVGSDHPNLPPALVFGALESARTGHPGWIPTPDGGFAAIALGEPSPELFAGVPWSTSGAADAVRRNAERAGIELREIGRWYDVDTAEDLLRLEHDLDLAPAAPGPRTPAPCPATARLLDSLTPPLRARLANAGSPRAGSKERPS